MSNNVISIWDGAKNFGNWPLRVVKMPNISQPYTVTQKINTLGILIVTLANVNGKSFHDHSAEEILDMHTLQRFSISP